MLHYEGLFFEGDNLEVIKNLEINKLPFINDEIHCTFKYKPNKDEVFNDIVGKEFTVTIIGYGSDKNNSGFLIELPKELLPYYINYDENGKVVPPHITSSISKGAKAKNTQYLEFIKLDNPVTIVGKFGFWLRDRDKEYLSFQQYK